MQIPIPTGWKETTLGEVILPVSETYNFNNLDEIHFLNTGDIQEGKLLHNNYSSVNNLPGQAKKKFKQGDILFSEIRPENKRFMLVNFNAEHSVASTKLMVLRCREGVDTNFVYKLITSNDAIQEFQIIAESRSGTFPQITFDAISKFPIILPSLPEQRAIADMLSSFDAKIELLGEQNEILEKTTQTIFHEWFGRYSVESLEEFPEGWRVAKITEIVDHIKIPVIPQNNVKQYFSHYSLPAFDDGGKPVVEKGETIMSNKYKVVGYCFLVSKLNPSTPRIWTIFSPEENAVCSTEFQVIKPKMIEYFSFVFGLLKSKYFTEKFASGAHGTSGSHQRANPEDIMNMEIPIPTQDLLTDFNNNIFPLIQKIQTNTTQIQSLSKIRDTLLPKLMGAEVRVI